MRKNEFHELAQSVERTAESMDQKDFLVQLMAFLSGPETETKSATDWKYRFELSPAHLRAASDALAEIADTVERVGTKDSDDVAETMETLDNLRLALAGRVAREVGRA